MAKVRGILVRCGVCGACEALTLPCPEEMLQPESKLGCGHLFTKAISGVTGLVDEETKKWEPCPA